MSAFVAGCHSRKSVFFGGMGNSRIAYRYDTKRGYMVRQTGILFRYFHTVLIRISGSPYGTQPQSFNFYFIPYDDSM